MSQQSADDILRISRQRLLKSAAVLLGSTALLTFFLLDERHPSWLKPVTLVCCVLSVISILLARRGLITLGGLLLAGMTVAGISANNPLTAAYVMPLFFAGMVLGSRSVLVLQPVIFGFQLHAYWTTPAAVLARSLPAPQMTILVTTVTGVGVWYLLRLIEQMAASHYLASVSQAQLEKEADLGVVFRFLHHELRSAVSGLRSYLAIVGSDTTDPELLAGVRATVENVGQLASRLFVLSRDRQVPAHRDSIDLAALLDEQIAQLRCFGGTVRYTISAGPGSLFVIGDRTSLAMALNTAIRNSLEAYSLDVSPVVTIRVVCTNVLRIEIVDDGPGFPASILQSQQPLLGMTTKTNGSGIGLALVSGVARMHGGQALFFNRPEGGACVVLELPLALLVPADLLRDVEPNEVCV